VWVRRQYLKFQGRQLLQALRRNFTPFLVWWPQVTKDTFRADALAGFTGAIVVIPQGIAFASIAGMPPEFGLYAAMIPAIIAALFGSSPQLVSGPTTAASIVVFSSLSALAIPGSEDYVRFALTLTFMVGVIELTLGLARLGVLVNFVSHSVIVGFTAGAAILIALNQVENFFGLSQIRGGHIIERLAGDIMRLNEMHPFAALVGFVTVASGILSRRWWPRMPYMLSAMFAGTATSVLLNFFLTDSPFGPVPTVGLIPATLPPLSAPDFSLSTIRDLAPAALAVTMFALSEAVSISRSLASRSGDYIDGNQEFIGQGLSNIVGSFFSSYVATGSFNRSGMNYEAGARTPLAAIMAGALLMVIVIVVAPALAYLPDAAMAGILFLIAWGLIDFRNIKRTTKASSAEALVLWVTFFATLFLELEFAIILGVMLSLGVFLRQASRPRVQVRAPDPRLPKHRFNTDPDLAECPQLKMIRIDGAIFFGAVNYVAERLRILARRSPAQKHLLVLARSINFVDVAGAELLARESRHRRAMGGGLYFHQMKDGVKDPIHRGGYMADIGEDNLFDSKGEAISEVFKRLDRRICQRCDVRIFSECQGLPRDEVAPAPAV
jgi:SulP family sulfate permease